MLLRKTKPITVGTICRPPNRSNFLQTLDVNFTKLDTLEKGLYILTDFNINLYQNQNHAGSKSNTLVSVTVSYDVKNCIQFWTMLGTNNEISNSYNLLQYIINWPHISKCPWNIFPGECSKYWFFKSRTQLLQQKNQYGGVEKKTKFHSPKNYVVDVDKNALRKTSFRDYENFEDVNRVYLDFFQKLREGIDNIAPCKTKRVKGNSQNWFDGEVLEKCRSRDKLFKAFKKTRLRIDK